MGRWWVLGLCVGVGWGTLRVPLQVHPQSVTVQVRQETLRVATNSNWPALDVPGAPDLPTTTIHLLLPYGQRAIQVSAKILDLVPLGEGILPRVHWTPPPGIASYTDDLPRTSDPKVLRQDNPVRGFQTGTIGGYSLVGALVSPFIYDTQAHRLFLITDLELEIETAPTEPGLHPLQADPGAWATFLNRLQRLVINPEQELFARPPVTLVEPSPDLLFPPPVNPTPSPASGPYPLLILTDTTLLTPFLAYAEWHTIFGRPAAVFTFSWIESHYPGADRAERVRNFLREAYVAWGVQWVLLAADAPLSPVRTFFQNPYWGSPSDQFPPSDLYFACLDGTWDRDGDHIYGEVEDSVDALPELYIGRIPVHTPDQAWAFVQKAMAYATSPADPGYPRRALALGTDLWGAYEGALYTEQVISNAWPASLEILRMYETDSTQNTLAEFLATLDQGVGQLYMNAHAFYHFFMVNMHPSVWFGYAEVPLLANTGRFPFLNIVACDVGGWDLHAIMESWLRAEDRGAAGILTVTRLDFPDIEVSFNIASYQALFDSIRGTPTQGDAFYAQTQFWPYTAYLSLVRYIYLSKTLLGDPALPVWTDSLRTLVSQHPDTLQVGPQTFSIQVLDAGTGSPIPGARVVAVKPGEVYVSAQTDLNGTAVLSMHPQTPGLLFLSVQDRNAVPIVDTLSVVPGPFAPRFTLLGFNDVRAGDGDGRVDIGEYGFLRVQITNEGAVPGTGVWVRWVFPDSGFRTVPMAPRFVVLPPGSTTTMFSIPIRVSLGVSPGVYPLLLYSGESETGPPPPLTTPHTPVDTLFFEVHAPRLRAVRFVHRLRGDTLELWPDLWNIGTDEARSIRIRIRPGPGMLEALDTLYGPLITLAPGEGYLDTTDAPLRLRVDPNHLSQTYETWFFEETRGLVDTLVLWNAEVPPATTLQATPRWPGLRLTWQRASSHRGFLVFRRIGDTGPVERLTPMPLPLTLYEDLTAPVGQPLIYWVVAVDTLGNSSPPSESLVTYAGLPAAPGWPQLYGMGGESHHPTVADFDPSSPGLEIAFGTANGQIYLYHADGTLADGWPVSVDGEMWNTVAAGDLDGDGLLELVAAPFRGDTTPNRVYAFEADGTPVTGWPVDYSPGPGRGSYAPPLVGDLDGDGAPEVFVHHIRGKIYAWHGDGSPYLPGSDGFFANAGTGGFNSGYLALADIDEDGSLELICASNDPNQTLVAFDPQGNLKPGFPLSLNARAQGGIAVGDLDPSVPGLEIVFVRSDSHELYAVSATGTVLPGWPVSLSGNPAIYNQPSLGDVDGDGAPEVLINDDSGVIAFNADGTVAQTFLFNSPLGQIFSQPLAIDINADGTDEVFCAYREGLLYGWQPDGTPIPGLPLFLADELKTTPAVVDLDGDGTLEIVVLGTDRLIVFTLPGSQSPALATWPMHAHDPGNTSALVLIAPRPTALSTIENPAMTLFLPPFPNPTRSSAILSLALARSQRVNLVVYDATGRRIATLVKAPLPAGWYTWTWPGIVTPKPASGLYFIHLETPDLRKTYPLVLTR